MKSSKSVLPYELHITEDLSKDPNFRNKRIIVLCVPSGAELEYCEYWELNDGLKSVISRQYLEPWSKYLQKASDTRNQNFEDKISNFSIVSFPTDDRNEKTPQNEELYKKISNERKGKAVSNKKDGNDEKIKSKQNIEKVDQNKAKSESKKSPTEEPKKESVASEQKQEIKSNPEIKSEPEEVVKSEVKSEKSDNMSAHLSDVMNAKPNTTPENQTQKTDTTNTSNTSNTADDNK